jgi:hypothetical protein
MNTAHEIKSVNFKKNKGQLRLFSDSNLCGSPSCYYCNAIRKGLEDGNGTDLIDISSKSSTSQKIETLRLILEEANGRFLNNFPNFKQEDNPKPAA